MSLALAACGAAVARVRARVESWYSCPLRRKRNEIGVDADHTLWLVSSTALLPSILLRIWLLEGLPGLALQCAHHILLMAGLAVLITWRRGTYVVHRELLTTLALLDCCFMVRNIAANGGANFFLLHGGSPLRLLALMVMCGHAVWCAAYGLYHRLDLQYSRVALPMVALLPLWVGESICHRLLQAPGVHRPLSELYSTLGLIHSVMAFPGGALLAQPADGSGPMQQCLTVDTWLLGWFGVQLPLFLLAHLERRQRLSRNAAHAGNQQDRATAGLTGGHGQAWAGAPSWRMQLYLRSCLVWHAMRAVQVLRLLLLSHSISIGW